jgi:hypothetical protein
MGSRGTPAFRLVFKVHITIEADLHKEAIHQSKHPRV